MGHREGLRGMNAFYILGPVPQLIARSLLGMGGRRASDEG